MKIKLETFKKSKYHNTDTKGSINKKQILDFWVASRKRLFNVISLTFDDS